MDFSWLTGTRIDSYLNKLQVRESAHTEVWYVLEGGAWDLSDAPAHGATFRSALGAAQRGRAVQVAPVWRRTKLWGRQRQGWAPGTQWGTKPIKTPQSREKQEMGWSQPMPMMWREKAWRHGSTSSNHTTHVGIDVTHIRWSTVAQWDRVCWIINAACGEGGGETGPSEFKAGGICDWLALVMWGGLIWEQERASGNLLYAC